MCLDIINLRWRSLFLMFFWTCKYCLSFYRLCLNSHFVYQQYQISNYTAERYSFFLCCAEVFALELGLYLKIFY